MRWIKWILILAVVLVGLSVGSIYFLFNPTLQKLKPEIVKTLTKSLGAEVEIGDISAQILPSPKVELIALSIGGENGAKLKRLFIDSSISQLLTGKLAISDITIEGPSAEIIKLEDGSFKIGTLKFGEKSEGSVGKNSGESTSPSEGAQKSIDLKISKLSVTNGSFVYSEVSKDSKISVSDLSLELNNFSPENSSPIKFGFSLFGETNANILGEGTFVPNSFKTKTPLLNLVVKLNSLDLNKAVQVATKFSADLNALTAQGALSGQVKLDGDASGLKTALELDGTDAALRFIKKDGEVVLNKAAATTLKLSANGELSPARVFNLQSFNLRLQDSSISGASVIDLEDKINTVKKLSIVLDKVNVSDLNRFVTVPTLTEGSFAGKLQLDLSKKPIPEMEGSIDIAGANLGTSNISQLNGKLVFQKNLVSSDSLTLNYKGEDVTVSGELLKFSGNNFDSPAVKVSALGGTVLVQNSFQNEGAKPFSGSISGGAIDLRRLVALSTNVPPYSVSGTLNKVASTFKGTTANLKQDLAANFSVGIVKGEIIGVNLIGGVFQKIGSIPGIGESLLLLVPEKYKPLVSAANTTSFDAFNIDGSLSQGSEINLSKAELIHSAYLILGTGRASTNGRLDLKTQMKITRAVTEGMVAKNAKLQLLLDKEGNLTFPLLITKGDGPVIVLPDITELGKNALRNSANDAASKALDKVAPGLGKGASQLLNKLF